MPPKLSSKRNMEEGSQIPPKIPTLTPSPTQCPLFGRNAVNSLAPCPLFGETTTKPILFISSLCMGTQKNSSIIGRVTLKSELRSWKNAYTEGCALTFDLADSTGEISVTAFNSSVRKFNELIEVDKVIQITGFRVKPIDERYLRIPGQEMELVLDNSSILSTSSATIPEIKFLFLNINDLMEKSKGNLCGNALKFEVGILLCYLDFLGIIYEDTGLIEGDSKEGKKFSFRNLMATDRTKLIFTIKIWGQTALDFCFDGPVAVAIRRGKVDEYLGDKCLNVGVNSLFWVRPDIEKAVELMEWLKEARIQSSQ